MGSGVFATALRAAPIGAFSLSFAPGAVAPKAPKAPRAPSVPAVPSGTGKAPFRVADFNVQNFFDTVDDPATGDMLVKPQDYAVKLEKLSRAIREKLGSPDVVALEEVENQRVVDDLLKRPEMQALGYKGIAGGLNDRRGIRVALLYRSASIDVTSVETYNPAVQLPDSAKGQVDPSLLYARPPLIVGLRYHGAAQAVDGVRNLDMTIVVNHFKSKLGGPGPEPRRQKQGEMMGAWVDARRAANPNQPVIVVGDLNAGYGEGAYEKLAKRPDGTSRLWDTPLSVKASDRYTYDYRGQHDMLDHVLVTGELQKAHTGTSIQHFDTAAGAKQKAGDPSVADGVSDHDAIVSSFDLAKLLTAATA